MNQVEEEDYHNAVIIPCESAMKRKPPPVSHNLKFEEKK
jgi:hypothetical protein